MLRSGVPEGELREELLREGYSEEELKKIFTPHRYDMRSWYLSFAIILLIAGIWLYLTRDNLTGIVFSIILFLTYFWEHYRIKRDQGNRD